MSRTVVVETVDIFAARMIERMVENGGPTADGGYELRGSPEDVLAVIESMRADGIDPDATHTPVSASEAEDIAAWTGKSGPDAPEPESAP